MSIKGFKINDNIEKIDYESLENKPFYTETITEIDSDIIPQQEVEGVSSGDLPEGYLVFSIDSIQAIANIVDKGQYNLTIDGAIKQVTTIFNQDIGVFLFGNLSIAGIGEDTKETYMGMVNVTYDEKDGFITSFSLFLQTTEPTHTIGLSYVGNTAPIIAEGTYTFIDNDNLKVCTFANISDSHFKEDAVYNFTFDGHSYENLPLSFNEDSEMYYIGNPSIMGWGNDNGEEYLCLLTPQDSGFVNILVVTPNQENDYVVSLNKSLVKTIETIHKVDNKYLDIDVDGLQNLQNLQNNVDKLQNFIGNPYIEQFYERYGVNKIEYPYITIQVHKNITIGEGNTSVRLIFSHPVDDDEPNYIKIMNGITVYSTLDTSIFSTKDVGLKTIINHLLQVPDSEIQLDRNSYWNITLDDQHQYIYYNYENETMNKLVNCLMLDADILTLQNELYNIKNTLINSTTDDLIVNSVTEGSAKKFKIMVDDSGVISAVEVTE